jgi:hypothetical protein
MSTNLISNPLVTGRAKLHFDSKLKNIFLENQSKVDLHEGFRINFHQERITNQQIEIWHDQGIQLSNTHAKSQWQMVEVLSKIEENHGYAYFHCSSLREYAILYWNLSENVASDMVTVAKKSIHVPQIIEALKNGRGTLSKIRKVCPVIDETNYQKWLDLVKECTSRIIEKTVALAKPETAVIEKVKYTSAHVLEVTHGMTEEIYLELQRVQDLLCQKEQRTVSRSEALQYLIHLGLETLDPIRKAKRAAERKVNKNSKAANQTNCSQKKSDQVLTKNDRAVVTGRTKKLRKRFTAETTHALGFGMKACAPT